MTEHEQQHLRQAFMRGFYQRSVGSFNGPVPGLTGIPLFEHFLQHGLERNISPTMFFDSAYYQSQLAQPVDIPFVLHFLREGAAAGLKPHRLVDPAYMVEKNGTLADRATVLGWLNTDDGRDARTHPLFWGDYYLESNSDIEIPDISALGHYLLHPFQTKQKSPREPNPFFCSRWYAERSTWKEGDILSPLEHFVGKGMLDDLSPTPLFDNAHYRDVSGVGRGPESPGSAYLHFMTEGLWNDVSPHTMVDPAFMRARFGDVLPPGQPAVLHYLRTEHEQLLQPGPRFHPRGVHGLKVAEGRQSAWRGHVLERYLMGDARGTRLEAPLMVKDDVRDELLAVGEIAPDYAVAFLDKADGLQRQNFNVFLDPRTRLLDILDAEIGDDIKAIIAIPAFRHGGAELIASNIARVFDDLGIPTVVLVTELAVTADLGWFPEHQSIIDLASMRKQLAMSPEDVVRVLGEFLLGAEPAVVVNVNSKILWQTYDTYGLTLSQVMSLWTNLFCFDYDDNGFPVGYANRLVETIDYLDTILVDNQTFADLVCERFGFGGETAEKFAVSRTPMLAQLEVKPTFALPADRRPKALWTGRFAPQKRPDFCYEVAVLVPEVDFVMYGTGAERPDDQLTNVIDGGVYDSFASIAPWEFDLFFHTAAWEGLPVSIVEAAAAGLPVIAPLVGGIGEILDAETGYPLTADASPEDYAAAVRACIEDRDDAERRAAALRERVGVMHSWGNFADVVAGQIDRTRKPHPGPFNRFSLDA